MLINKPAFSHRSDYAPGSSQGNEICYLPIGSQIAYIQTTARVRQNPVKEGKRKKEHMKLTLGISYLPPCFDLVYLRSLNLHKRAQVFK